MMKMRLFTLLLGLFMCVLQSGVVYAQDVADNEGEEESVSTDNRMRELLYDPDDVYVIHTLFGYQTNVVLGDAERIKTISVGDRSLWQIVPAGNRLFIRPMVDNVRTNMTLLTDTRSYQFDLVSGSGEPEDNPELVYVARFTYPEPEKPEPPLALVMSPVVTSAVPAGTEVVYEEVIVADNRSGQQSIPPQPEMLQKNTYYTYTGDDALAPVQVYDDGYKTYMKFADMTSPMPKVYALTEDGGRIQLPIMVKSGYLVIDAVEQRLELTGDSGTVVVYNELLLPEAS